MKRFSVNVRMSCALFMLLMALPAVAAEKWWDAYNRGVKAVNARNYDLGADALQKAIAEMPAENSAARARNEIITYVPHFFLGIARFNLGDIDGALREWKISEDQGAIQKTDYYSKLRDWVARAQTEKQRKAQGAASDSKKNADAALSRALSGQMEALSAGGDRSDNYRAAQRKLQEALAQFNKAGTDVLAYQRAAETAGQARELFATAAEEAKSRKASRPAVAAKSQQRPVVSAAQTTGPAVQPAQPPPVQQEQGPIVVQRSEKGVTLTQPEPKRPPVQSESLVNARVALQQYRRRLMDAQAAAPTNRQFQSYAREALGELEKLQQELSAMTDEASLQKMSDALIANDRELTARLTKAVSTIPGPEIAPLSATRSQLESAYRAFATGDLDESEEMLSRIIQTTQSGEAYLLRGCARYTRAILARDGKELLSGAENDFRSALRINRSLRLDKTTFSPKLIDFFDQVRSSS